MENKHEQLVWKIAEEMASAEFNNISLSDLPDGSFNQVFYKNARIAVKHMAESYMSGNTCRRDGDDHEDCFNEMRKRGLIPSPENKKDGE